MNTLSAPQRPSGLPDTLRLLPLQGRAPRTSLVDRVAMRIAVALLLWSTRPTPTPESDPERVARERAFAERRRREAEWLLAAHHLSRL